MRCGPLSLYTQATTWTACPSSARVAFLPPHRAAGGISKWSPGSRQPTSALVLINLRTFSFHVVLGQSCELDLRWVSGSLRHSSTWG